MEKLINEKTLVRFPEETAMGALSYYITHASITKFQPMNVNFGIIKPLEERVKKKDRKAAYAIRAVEVMDKFIEQYID